ncbi:MAG: hypothetical protein HYV20_05835 [Gemmatimonadetes bacterium]|nr:hypothetical protein [Gemmatimonadota bacterium]
MTRKKRGQRSANEGIQARDVKAEVIAVGRGAHAVKTDGHSGGSVTITLGAGATFTGDVVTAQRVERTLRVAQGVASPQLRRSLEELIGQTGKLLERLEPAERQNEVARSLETLVEEASKPTPDKRWYQLSSEGLIDAAKTVAALTEPVTSAVKAVLALLL